MDLLPGISETQIRDKSKASGLAKTLVCIQAAWFCMQCIVRLTQGLTISLLELNTFAHALCAFIVYILWWNKPLDIEESTPIPPRDITDALFVASDIDYDFHPWVEIEITQNISDLDLIPPIESDLASHASPGESLHAIFCYQRRPSTPAESNIVRSQQSVHGWALSHLTFLGKRHDMDSGSAITLNSSDMEKLRIKRLAYRHFRPSSLPQIRLKDRVRNTPNIGGIFEDFQGSTPIQVRMVLGFTITGGMYGGVHLVA